MAGGVEEAGGSAVLLRLNIGVMDKDAGFYHTDSVCAAGFISSDLLI